jgi:phospholipase/carboxylesterase
MLNFHGIPPTAGGKPLHAVIILHGLGDSGRGLLSLGEAWKNALPDTEFLCPDAPFAFDGLPMPDARQWFGLRQFSMQEMRDGVMTAAPYLDDFIDRILESRTLPPEKIALVGFSQGTMMALYVAPRREKQIAGIIGYSGLLVGGDTLLREKKSAPPVLLIHGTADEVVPYAALDPSAAGLHKAGLIVETITCSTLGHGIDERGLAAGLTFLKRVFT